MFLRLLESASKSILSSVTIGIVNHSMGGLGNASGAGGDVNLAPANLSTDSESDDEVRRLRLLGVRWLIENRRFRRLPESESDEEDDGELVYRVGILVAPFILLYFGNISAFDIKYRFLGVF
jgi:hypothetical protein